MVGEMVAMEVRRLGPQALRPQASHLGHHTPQAAHHIPSDTRPHCHQDLFDEAPLMRS